MSGHRPAGALRSFRRAESLVMGGMPGTRSHGILGDMR
jgi:hypothetical protein